MRHAIVLLVTGFMTWSCSGDGGAGPDAGEVPAASQEAAAQPRYPTLAELLPENVPWKGDLDGIIERRVFRLLVAYNRTSYFIDQGREYGLAPDVFREFEKWFNERQGRGHLKVSVAFMPVSRDELLSALTQGLGDIAVANITVTPERSALVDFSDPLYDGAQEIVVTGPDAAPVASLEDLSGRTLYVRPSSSYRESLEALNADFSRSRYRPRRHRARRRKPRDRGHPRDGQRWPRRSDDRRQAPRRFLGTDPGWDQAPSGPRRALRWSDCMGVPEEQSQAGRGAERFRQADAQGHAARQHASEALPEEHQVRGQRDLGRGPGTLQPDHRLVPGVRGQVRLRLADAGRAGLSGVRTRSVRAERGRGDRHHAAAAEHRGRSQRGAFRTSRRSTGTSKPEPST